MAPTLPALGLLLALPAAAADTGTTDTGGTDTGGTDDRTLALEVDDPLYRDVRAIAALPRRVFVSTTGFVIELTPRGADEVGAWPLPATDLAVLQSGEQALVAACTNSALMLLRPDADDDDDTGTPEITETLLDGRCGAVAARGDGETGVLAAVVGGDVYRWTLADGRLSEPEDLGLAATGAPRLAVLDDHVALAVQGTPSLYVTEAAPGSTAEWRRLALGSATADVAWVRAPSSDGDTGGPPIGDTAWVSLPDSASLVGDDGRTLPLAWAPGLLTDSDVDGNGVRSLTIGRQDTGGFSAMGDAFDGALYLEDGIAQRGLVATDLNEDRCEDHLALDSEGTARIIWTTGCSSTIDTALEHDLPDSVDEGSLISGNFRLADGGASGTWTVTVTDPAGVTDCSLISNTVRCSTTDDATVELAATWIGSDGRSEGSTSHTVTVDNIAPVLADIGGPCSEIPTGNVVFDGPTSQRLQGYDPGEDDVSFELTGDVPEWMEVNADGQLTAAPAGTGAWYVSLSLTDEDGGETVYDFSVVSTVPGGDESTPKDDGGGCGCSSGPIAPGAVGILLLAPILALRRRRPPTTASHAS